MDNNLISKKEGRNYLPYLLIFVITICIVLYFIFPIKVLEVSNYTNGEILKYFKINDNSQIGIIYIHSVEKTETSEWYKVQGKNLVLMEQRFKSQGAGLPADSSYKFEKYEDGYRLFDINKEMNNVIYRTGRIIADHKLEIDGEIENFIEFSNPGDAVIFHVKSIFNFEFIKWRCLNDNR